MRLSDFAYELPPELIAQTPLEPRDAARLLVLPRSSGDLAHHLVRDLPDLLRPGDLLIANRSRVLPARIRARLKSGGAAEFLLLRRLGRGRWETLARPARRLRVGDCATVAPDVSLQITAARDEGIREVVVRLEPTEVRQPSTEATEVRQPSLEPTEVRQSPPIELTKVTSPSTELTKVTSPSINRTEVWTQAEPLVATNPDADAAATPDPDAALLAHGSVPLPPYIRGWVGDPERYQTIFADSNGSAAAPTAGLHFTASLLERLASAGVVIETITLHVGLDTFRPIAEDDPGTHRMHREWYTVPPAIRERIAATRVAGGRVVAVGTTSVRALEAWAATGEPEGWTDLFIQPGFQFQVVDALITNFHLPRSTLLMLVSAFAGRERILAAYAAAIREGYRFYSFGDAMLIG